MVGSVPVPDPTVLTTQQLQREIATSREVVETHLEGIKRVIETRLEGMDKAIALLQISNDRIPTHVNEMVTHLKSLHEERFHSIATQFLERDTRTEQTSRDSKVAVDAALQAAKEAVGEQNKSNALAIAKSETTFTKQIDQIGILISALQKGFDDKIDDIKTRLQSMEGQRKGAFDSYGFLIGVIATVIAIVSVTVAAIRR